MIARVFLAAAFVAAAFNAAAFAHQQKAAVTEILFNARTNNIEVAHRFIMHDAEHAARAELGIDGDLYGSPETRSAFAAYVAERFSLTAPDGASLQLVLQGAEIKDGYLWVYQETQAPDGLDALSVRHGALRDVWPDQVNRVNVKRGDEVRTLVFTGGADLLQVDFDE
ncbi:MAG: DUF6702 family protein [Pseudomonadota bacterium]